MNINALNGVVAVVAHDAGAANLIIGWCKKNTALEVRTTLAGPAAKLWNNAFGHSERWSLKGSLQGANILLSGTSHESNLEHQARILAQDLGIRSAGIIDHWVNYPQRFIRHGVQILPDEIWVTDPEALKIASTYFSKTPIHLQPNDYLNDLVSQITKSGRAQSSQSLRVLYVLEPIRNWGADGNPGEFQALEYFLKNSQLVGVDFNCKILLRPHPSDNVKKYDYWLKRQSKWNLGIDTSTSLEEAIAGSDIVVGCETYALIVALAAGKRAISSIPAHAPRCRLPSKGIIHLRDILLNFAEE